MSALVYGPRFIHNSYAWHCSGSFCIPGPFNSVHAVQGLQHLQVFVAILLVSPDQRPWVSISQILLFCLAHRIGEEPRGDGTTWCALAERHFFCKQLDLSNHAGHQLGCLWTLRNFPITEAGNCLLRFCWKPLEICVQ